MVSALPVVGSIVGGVISAKGAKSAANTQAQAARDAAQVQQNMFDTTQKNLQPYMQSGQYANNALLQAMGLGPSNYGGSGAISTQTYDPDEVAKQLGISRQSPQGRTIVNLFNSGKTLDSQMAILSDGTTVRVGESGRIGSTYDSGGPQNYSAEDQAKINAEISRLQQLSGGFNAGTNPLTSNLLSPIKMDQATLEKTPGYQFNLSQGLRATQNAAAARGLGISGAALKGASAFATGLADSTYQNQFANEATNRQNTYNRLFDVTNLGANAAAGLGGIGQKTGENIGGNITDAGSAIGAGKIGAATAIGSGISGAANTLGGYLSTAANRGNGYGMYADSYNPEAAANGLPWSDIRLKENIIPMGEENGFKIYEFNYLWSPIKYIGVMAQEVAEIIPEAVKKVGDYFAVDYSRINVRFRNGN